MTTLVRITIAFILALFLSSCGFDINFGKLGTGKKGNGIVVEENRDVRGDFSSIHASEGLEVFVTQAGNYKVTVEADENVIDLIATEIKNGKLRVYAIENIGRATKKVFVSLPHVEELSSSSGANLMTQNNLKGNRLRIDSSSGSIVQATIFYNAIEVDASSGAQVDLSGETDQVYVDASSGANIKAMDLKAEECRAEGSSGANITVNVSESLTADASSGANISYSGNAAVTTKKSVAGSVHKY